jgi:membrane associated rhomboid family serine protease
MIAPVRISPTVKLIAILCLVGFVVQHAADQFFGAHLLQQFGLVPKSFIIDKYFWQILTYPFLHGDILHLFLNLAMMVFIGSDLEYLWGRRKFTAFFFTCSSFAGLLYLLLQAWVYGGEGLYTPMVGASGAIYGLLMAYGVIFGERVMLFMMLFPMKAKYFIWLLALIEFMSSVFSGKSGLSSAAHIGGMVAGLAFVALDRRFSLTMTFSRWAQKVQNPKRTSKKSHLKLVIDNDSEEKPPRNPKTWH